MLLQKQLDDFRVIVLRGDVDGFLSLVVGRVDVRAQVQQQPANF